MTPALIRAVRHPHVDPRRDERVDVAHRTTVSDGRRSQRATIVNLSRFGLLARTDTDFEPGAVVSVSLPVVGAVEAEVVWGLGGRAGCQFVDVISEDRYALILSVIPRH